MAELLLEAYDLGTWWDVHKLIIERGKLFAKTAEKKDLFIEVSLQGLRLRSRNAKKRDCNRFLKPGTDVCVYSTHPRTKFHNSWLSRCCAWYDAKIISANKKPHGVQCSCKFFVKFYEVYKDDIPHATTRKLHNSKKKKVEIDQIAVLQAPYQSHPQSGRTKTSDFLRKDSSSVHMQMFFDDSIKLQVMDLIALSATQGYVFAISFRLLKVDKIPAYISENGTFSLNQGGKVSSLFNGSDKCLVKTPKHVESEDKKDCVFLCVDKCMVNGIYQQFNGEITLTHASEMSSRNNASISESLLPNSAKSLQKQTSCLAQNENPGQVSCREEEFKKESHALQIQVITGTKVKRNENIISDYSQTWLEDCKHNNGDIVITIKTDISIRQGPIYVHRSLVDKATVFIAGFRHHQKHLINNYTIPNSWKDRIEHKDNMIRQLKVNGVSKEDFATYRWLVKFERNKLEMEDPYERVCEENDTTSTMKNYITTIVSNVSETSIKGSSSNFSKLKYHSECINFPGSDEESQADGKVDSAQGNELPCDREFLKEMKELDEGMIVTENFALLADQLDKENFTYNFYFGREKDPCNQIIEFPNSLPEECQPYGDNLERHEVQRIRIIWKAKGKNISKQPKQGNTEKLQSQKYGSDFDNSRSPTSTPNYIIVEKQTDEKEELLHFGKLENFQGKENVLFPPLQMSDLDDCLETHEVNQNLQNNDVQVNNALPSKRKHKEECEIEGLSFTNQRYGCINMKSDSLTTSNELKSYGCISMKSDSGTTTSNRMTPMDLHESFGAKRRKMSKDFQLSEMEEQSVCPVNIKSKSSHEISGMEGIKKTNKNLKKKTRSEINSFTKNDKTKFPMISEVLLENRVHPSQMHKGSLKEKLDVYSDYVSDDFDTELIVIGGVPGEITKDMKSIEEKSIQLHGKTHEHKKMVLDQIINKDCSNTTSKIKDNSYDNINEGMGGLWNSVDLYRLTKKIYSSAISSESKAIVEPEASQRNRQSKEYNENHNTSHIRHSKSRKRLRIDNMQLVCLDNNFESNIKRKNVEGKNDTRQENTNFDILYAKPLAIRETFSNGMTLPMELHKDETQKTIGVESKRDNATMNTKVICNKLMASISNELLKDKKPIIVQSPLLQVNIPSHDHVESDMMISADCIDSTAEIKTDGMEYIWEDMEAVFQVENQSLETKHERQEDKGCGGAEHALYLDEEIGLICQNCNHVTMDIKSILPPFETLRHMRHGNESANNYVSDKDCKELIPILDDLKDLSNSQCNQLFDKHNSVWSLISELRGKMENHQRRAFEFLWKNITGSLIPEEMNDPYSFTSGCIIAHAPGTGKSLTIISFLQSYLALFPRCRPLIIMPKIMLKTWEREFKKWNVKIPVNIVNSVHDFAKMKSKIRKEIVEDSNNSNRQAYYLYCLKLLLEWHEKESVLLISYPLFSALSITRNQTILCDEAKQIADCLTNGPRLVILDEGHIPRNHNSKMWNALMKVKSNARIILSGTLFQNNLEEYFNTLCLARPSFVDRILDLNRSKCSMSDESTKEKAARHFFIEEIGKNIKSKEKEDRDAGHLMLKSLTKDFIDVYQGDVLEKLPGLKIYTVMLKLTVLQEYFQELIQETFESEKNVSYLEKEIMTAAVSVHPCLIKELAFVPKYTRIANSEFDECRKVPNQGIKLKFVIDVVRLCRRRGEKVLIFSQNIAPLVLLKETLEDTFHWYAGQEILVIDGSNSSYERQEKIDRFSQRKGNAQVLLASVKTIGIGVNLTEASRVIFLDILWNPANSKQAISRAFRIGQEKIVYVYQLVADKTMEEDKYERTIWKKKISSLIFVGEESTDAENDIHTSKVDDEILQHLIELDKRMFSRILEQESAIQKPHNKTDDVDDIIYSG